MRRPSTVVTILALVATLLALAACEAAFPSVPAPVLLPASTETGFPATPCPPCDQATEIAALTQANINASALQAQAAATAEILGAQARATANAGTATQGAAQTQDRINVSALQAQAAATAEILGAQARATSNAGTSTQGAALTQDRSNVNALQAQAEATADVLRANALATFNAASSTQNGVLTQAADQQAQTELRLRLTAEAATQSAAATGTQQWMGALVAGTATTLARAVIDRTESAAAFVQRAADQRQEQQQGPIDFLWKWGLPLFILAAAGLGLWGFWRWLKMHTTRRRTGLQLVGGPLTIRERRRGLAEDLPTWLRRLAWFVETKSILAAPDRPAHAVVVIESGLADTPPAPDPVLPREREMDAATGLAPGVNGVDG